MILERSESTSRKYVESRAQQVLVALLVPRLLRGERVSVRVLRWRQHAQAGRQQHRRSRGHREARARPPWSCPGSRTLQSGRRARTETLPLPEKDAMLDHMYAARPRTCGADAVVECQLQREIRENINLA